MRFAPGDAVVVKSGLYRMDEKYIGRRGVIESVFPKERGYRVWVGVDLVVFRDENLAPWREKRAHPSAGSLSGQAREGDAGGEPGDPAIEVACRKRTGQKRKGSRVAGGKGGKRGGKR
jgi:hypothetical protein